MLITDMSMSSTINVGATVTYTKTDKFERNDIVVFDLPNRKELGCLRVVGMPGDKIEILKGKILINEKQFDRSSNSSMIYTVYSKIPTDFSNLQRYNFRSYSKNYGMVRVTMKEFEEIQDRKLVDSIYELGFDSLYVYPDIVKTSSSKYLNHFYFGPIHVPKMGDTIVEDDKSLLKLFTNFSYPMVANEEYYFCIGDSFSDAQDSRVIGLIPKSRILGKVTNIENATVVNVEDATDN